MLTNGRLFAWLGFAQASVVFVVPKGKRMRQPSCAGLKKRQAVMCAISSAVMSATAQLRRSNALIICSSPSSVSKEA